MSEKECCTVSVKDTSEGICIVIPGKHLSDDSACCVKVVDASDKECCCNPSDKKD